MNNFATKKRLLNLLLCLSTIWTMSSVQSNAQINTFPYNENFEGETATTASCGGTYNMLTTGWSNTGADTDWYADNGGTTSGSTGPSGPGGSTTGGMDHNPGTGTGIYLYLETSGACTNQEAILESPIFDFSSTPAPEITFWYHMYGATMGELNFEVTTNGGTSWTTLWTETGDQGNEWLPATLSLVAYGGMNNVQFRYRGITGTSFTSDMAIDDVNVIEILPNNSGIASLVSPAPGAVAGAYPIDVELKNFGGNNIDTVTIEWEMNGLAQTPFYILDQV